MTQVEVPLAASDRLLDRFGPEAAAWIDDFGTTVGELCQKWDLAPHTVRAGGTGAVVECVSTVDGTPYALKLSPDPAISEQESAALAYWAAAPAVVDLVDADAARGAMLLEWLPDTTELTAGTWGIGEVAGLITDLYAQRRTPPLNVPLAAERVEFMFELWDRRRRAAAVEMASGGESLLHGDLHPGNILRVSGGRGIVTIDPRPCVGDPAMDLTDLAMTGAGSEAAIRSRCRQLAEVADPIDAERIWLWCCNFAPLMAVSLARRGARTEEITFVRNLAKTR